MAVGSHSLWVASLGVMSEPTASLGRFFGPPPFLVPPLHGGRRPVTHSLRREVVSGPAELGVPTPRFQRHEGVALIEQTALLWQLGSCLFGLPPRGPSRPLERLLGVRECKPASDDLFAG